MSPKCRDLEPKGIGRGEIFLPAGLVACLKGINGLSPNGVAGFLQRAEQVDLVSILTSPITLAIVLTYRLGFSIAYVEGIESRRQNILPRVSRRDQTGQHLKFSPGKMGRFRYVKIS